MSKNLLIELGLEELPAYVVTPSEKQLGERLATFLTENRLSFENIQTFSTPRRLAARVIGLADQQTDLTEDFKGLLKKSPWIQMATSQRRHKVLFVGKV